MKRSLTKRLPSAPHETLLVLDGTTGLNMLNQAREFNQAVGLTGLILTKLDGSSKGARNRGNALDAAHRACAHLHLRAAQGARWSALWMSWACLSNLWVSGRESTTSKLSTRSPLQQLCSTRG